MIVASARFSEALAYSHRTLTRITIDGDTIPLESGSLNLNRPANVRRTANLLLRDDPATPGLLAGITTASQVLVEKGITFLDRSTEYVTVGTLYVQELDGDPDRLALAVVLSDAAQLVDDYPLITAWSPSSGGSPLTVVNSIKSLVDEAVPGTPTWSVDAGISTSQATLAGAVYKAGTGRWSAINELAAMLGAAVFVDAVGVWHIDPAEPDPTPVARIATGAGGVLVQASIKATRRDTYNGIAIEWGSTDTEGGIVLVTDDDPTSPTYWDGTWGRRPKPTTKLAVETEAEAIAAAAALLAGSRGAQSGINFQAVYNPLLEPNDVVTIATSPSTEADHVLDRITLPLVGGTMTAETRVVSAA
ncbi:MAG: hypothetical protein Q7V58_09435 [Actinomycetota bacterium]|nr:hypothetical protein [Actinomycetota bacterium]